MIRRLRNYALNILIAVDQLGNAILGGHPDETISSRAGKGKLRGEIKWCLLCALLHLFEEDHCEKSIERDEGKRIDAYERRSAQGGASTPTE